MSDPDLDLEQRLHDLAGGVTAPATPLADDVARGRRRLLRTRLAVGGSVVGVLAVVAAAVAVTPDDPAADRSPDFVGETDSPSASPSDPFLAGGALSPERRDELVITWQQALAEHLDPGWEHLVKVTTANSTQQSSSDGDGDVESFGSEYGWQNAGESGLGMLRVSVNAGWSDVPWLCGYTGQDDQAWDCYDATPPTGAVAAEVARHEGMTEVAVERADGQVVVLTTSALFPDSSTVPVSGIDLDDDALVAAAADPRLALPGVTVPAVPQVTTDEVRDVLADGLGSGRFEERYGANDHRAWLSGDWFVGSSRAGQVVVTAEPPSALPALEGCSPDQYVRCERPVVDGVELFVGHLPARASADWVVIRPGPTQTVQVAFDSTGGDGSLVTPEDAYAVVTAPRLHPDAG